MKLVLATILNTPAFAQCAPPVRCPRQQVVEFLNWDYSGTLLRQASEQSPNYVSASKFFLKYDDRMPKVRGIWVVEPELSSVDDVSIDGNSAEIYFGFEPFARLDEALQLHDRDSGYAKYFGTFHLTLSDRRWETDADGKTVAHEVKPPQWLITDPPQLYLNLEAAIQYVEGRRKQTTDARLQKNADATLSSLKRLKHTGLISSR